MPVIEVHLPQGYRPDDRHRLSESLNAALRLVVPEPPDAVNIMVHEMPLDNDDRDPTVRKAAAALPDPCELVEQFLAYLAVRDLAKATEFLGESVVMQFPGAKAMHQLSEMIEWCKPRYRSITKQIQGTEAFQSAGDETVVYCRGTLSGEWPDGSTFQAVRFIDRFELVAGKITRQDVWNDLAEARV